MKKKSARRRPAKRSSTGKARNVQKKALAAPKRAAKKTRSALKKPAAPATVAEYLARVPEPARSALNQIRAAIRSVVPAESTEVLSYKIPAFKHKKVLVWYAAFTDHCSLFPTAAVIEQFKDELKGFSTSKGTIHFPLDKPMPLELIKKLVEARVAAAKD
jgi:uncharacterized protein YdhG (YjbR/CyaY superfamily)